MDVDLKNEDFGMKLTKTLGLAALVSLGGCASTPQDVTLDVDPGVVQLSRAADEISESYKMLSYAESARVSATGIGKTLDYDEPLPVVLRGGYVGDHRGHHVQRCPVAFFLLCTF